MPSESTPNPALAAQAAYGELLLSASGAAWRWLLNAKGHFSGWTEECLFPSQKGAHLLLYSDQQDIPRLTPPPNSPANYQGLHFFSPEPSEYYLSLQLSRIQIDSPTELIVINQPSRDLRYGYFRRQIEQQFQSEIAQGIFEELLLQLDARQRLAGATYYLLQEGEETMAAGGLAIYEGPYGLVGRLQDIDVAQKYRGQGYGHRLLDGLISIAQGARTISQLVVRADADDFPLHWYRRRGFETICGARRYCSKSTKSLS